MPEKYKIAYKGGQSELIEKKSRFIGTFEPVESEEEAIALIDCLRKKYWDATHNCFAYVIGDRHQVQRFSDDGEPQGTAGKPILDVLLGEDVHNALVVVTRYFGGTLLGTGGLVRAYSKACREGLLKGRIIEKCPGFLCRVETDYNGIGKLQYIAGQMELKVMSTDYTDKVVMEVLIPMEQKGSFEKQVTEATAGRAGINMDKTVFYGIVDGNGIIFK